MNIEHETEKKSRDGARLKVATAEKPAAPFARAAKSVTDGLLSGGKVPACGDGGSAAAAPQFSAPPMGVAAVVTGQIRQAHRLILHRLRNTIDCHLLGVE